MQFVTLLPVADNDGSPVDERTLNRIVRGWSYRFGGATVEKDVQGMWVDEDGALSNDTCWKVTVACDNDLYAAAVKAVLRAGRTLKQKAMYFEVRDFDGVRILEVK